MAGCRKLTEDEFARLLLCMRGEYVLRDRLLAWLMKLTGARIAEALALHVKDVVDGLPAEDAATECQARSEQWGARLTDTIHWPARVVKGKRRARDVPANAKLRVPLGRWLAQLEELHGLPLFRSDLLDWPLFASRQGSPPRAIHTSHGSRIIRRAADMAQLSGRVGTHSFRKSFADKIFNTRKDVLHVQRALGHTSLQTTQRYLSSDDEELREIILSL